MITTTARLTESVRLVPATRNKRAEAVVSSPWTGLRSGVTLGLQAA